MERAEVLFRSTSRKYAATWTRWSGASVEETLNGLLERRGGPALPGRAVRAIAGPGGHAGRLVRAEAADEGGPGDAEGAAAAEPAVRDADHRACTGARESSVEEALMEMYLAGVSVRRVEDITEALWGTRVSPSTVSELNQKLYERIEAWRNQPIDGPVRLRVLDGIWLKRSWGGEVKNVAVLVAIGVDQDGYRQVLGVVEGAKEDAESWRNFLRHLKERGLAGVRAGHQRQVPGTGRGAGRVLSRGRLAAVHGPLVPQRALGGADGQGQGGGGDAQGDPRPGGPPGGRGEGGRRGGQAPAR